MKPSFIEQLVSFSKAATEHIKSGMAHATDMEKEKRASICDTCPLLDRENYKCTECGCYLKFKISWETSSCPKGKW